MPRKRYRMTSGKVVEVESANNVKGILLNAMGFISQSNLEFRIRHEDKSFTTYPVRHADPRIKFIDDDVYFYYDEEGNTWIDHSPAAFGYEEVKGN